MLIEHWNKLLWNHVEELHLPGNPLYLAFDQRTLQRLFVQEFGFKISPEECEKDFLYACNRKISLSSQKAVIAESVFIPNQSKRTLCLSYAVQQILAAEHMLEDDKYTANSYFPRYRTIIGLKDNGYQIPISYPQFKLIWNILKLEILGLPGANSMTITFKQGVGIDKNRALPMSQALLNYHNLNSIVNILGNIDALSDEMLLLTLRKRSVYLPKQVVKKIHNHYIVKPIIKQIRSYLRNKNKKESLIRKKRQRKDTIHAECFEIYIRTEGWEENYVLSTKDPAMYEELERLLSEFGIDNQYLFFCKGIAGEYTGCSLPIEITHGEKLLVVVQKTKFPIFEHNLIALAGKDSFHLNPENSAILPLDYLMVWYESDLNPGETLTIGKSGLHSKNRVAHNKLTFKGGLCLNDRNHEYLFGFPPDHLVFDGQNLPAGEEIKANRVPMTVASFLRELRTLQNEAQFQLEYLQATTKIRLLASREIQPLDIGYKLHNGNMAISTKLKVCDEDSYYKNWIFLNYVFPIKDKQGKISDFGINEKNFLMASSGWVPLSKKQIKEILFKLKKVCSGTVYLYVKERIIENGSIPPQVYKKLLRPSL